MIKLLLEELPQLLQNKTLILAASHEDIDRFAARLCAMVKKLIVFSSETLLNLLFMTRVFLLHEVNELHMLVL